MPLSPSLVLSSLSKIGVVKVGWLKKEKDQLNTMKGK